MFLNGILGSPKAGFKCMIMWIVKVFFRLKSASFLQNLVLVFLLEEMEEKYKAQKWSERMTIKECKGKKKPVIRQGQVYIGFIALL